ncbi:MAG: hypothetical protein ACFB0B_21085 [Thermonemataceae bacterium]
MTFEQLKDKVIQAFIQQHLEDDPTQLVLKAKQYDHLPIKAIAQHIQAKQKIKDKLPTWYAHPLVVYPAKISLEQSSSEATAKLKTSFVEGRALIDLTGGLGVDTFYFAKHFEKVIYVEPQKALCEVAQQNFKTLGAHNISCICDKASNVLSDYTGKVDVLYLDPARRDQQQRSIAQLEACEPNVLALLPQLFTVGASVLLKTSPMLDIQQALKQLKYVHQVVVVAYRNECKEVLYLLKPTVVPITQVPITTVHLGTIKETFTATFEQEAQASAKYGEPQRYLYEPNVAIMKAGFFQKIAVAFDLHKLHPDSHLYTSEHLKEKFPGRVFSIEAITKLDKSILARYVPERKASIIIRNFPQSAATIRKKINFKESARKYLIATTTGNKRIIIVATRLF